MEIEWCTIGGRSGRGERSAFVQVRPRSEAAGGVGEDDTSGCEATSAARYQSSERILSSGLRQHATEATKAAAGETTEALP